MTVVTASADVEIHGPVGEAHFTTSSGDVSTDDLAADVTAKTVGGDIRAHSASGDLRCSSVGAAPCSPPPRATSAWETSPAGPGW